jgi:hypothetical protein
MLGEVFLKEISPFGRNDNKFIQQLIFGWKLFHQ